MAEPTRAEQLQALLTKLETVLQQAAGGVDPEVQAVVAEMREVLTPT